MGRASPLTQFRRKSGPVPRTPGLVPRGPAPAPETAPSPSNPRLVPLDVKSVFCVFGHGAGYTCICVYLFACDATYTLYSRLLALLAPTLLRVLQRLQRSVRQPAHHRAATARARPRPWPRRWKRRPAGRGRGWGLPLEAWTRRLPGVGCHVGWARKLRNLSGGGNKQRRAAVYLAVYLVCICFQDKNTQIHAYPHPSPSVFNIWA